VLVEIAIISPFLFLILFAIIEFGYGYGQSLDVRHGAREASRLVAVNYRATPVTGSAQTTEIIAAACSRMQIVGGDGTTVSLGFVDTGPNQKDRGRFAVVSVRRPLNQVTNFLNFALDNVVLSSSVETRLEQDATWNATASPVACP
jgi:Flp pilus assembly protein TadG